MSLQVVSKAKGASKYGIALPARDELNYKQFQKATSASVAVDILFEQMATREWRVWDIVKQIMNMEGPLLELDIDEVRDTLLTLCTDANGNVNQELMAKKATEILEKHLKRDAKERYSRFMRMFTEFFTPVLVKKLKSEVAIEGNLNLNTDMGRAKAAGTVLKTIQTENPELLEKLVQQMGEADLEDLVVQAG